MILFARMWAAWVLLFWWADYCGWSSRCGWPPSQTLPGCRVRVTRWRAVKPRGPRANAAHWRAELHPGVWLQDPGFPNLVSDHWLVRPVPATACCRIWGVLKLVWTFGGWDRGSSGPKAGAGLLVGRRGPASTGCGAVVVLGLASALWLVCLVPESRAGLLVASGPRGFWSWCLPTGGQSWVPGCTLW